MTQFRIREGHDLLGGEPVTRIELGDEKNLRMFEFRDSLKNIPIKTLAILLEQLTDEWTSSKRINNNMIEVLLEENARLRDKVKFYEDKSYIGVLDDTV